MTSARQELGARAEAAVVAHLEREGLEILGTNVRIGRLELDVLARDGVVVAVIEVRFRGPGAWVKAFDSIDARKRARVRAAGEILWQRRFAGDASVERMRFDAARVEFDARGAARVEIVKAAF